MARQRLQWLALAIALGAEPAAAGDQVTLTQAGSDENGVIAWGKWASATDDAKYKTAIGYSSVTFENISDGAPASQLASFTVGRPPALDANVSWTSGADAITLAYPSAEYEIPVKMWILCADAACAPISGQKRANLDAMLVWANVRFLEERVGMKLIAAGGDEWVTDRVTVNADARNVLLDFTPTNCKKFDAAVSAIKQPNAINIYMVNTVEAEDSRGYQCRENYDSLVVGRAAIWGTIVHEVCHVFGLDHPDDKFVGGQKNFMSPKSTTRRWLTEGQVFRMHFETESGLNHSLSSLLPAGLPSHRQVRDCEDDTPGNRLPCPPLDMVLWKDQ